MMQQNTVRTWVYVHVCICMHSRRGKYSLGVNSLGMYLGNNLFRARSSSIGSYCYSLGARTHV